MGPILESQLCSIDCLSWCCQTKDHGTNTTHSLFLYGVKQKLREEEKKKCDRDHTWCAKPKNIYYLALLRKKFPKPGLS